MTPEVPAFLCIQAMWRTCGTYVWSKFPEPAFQPYFEPCSDWRLDPRVSGYRITDRPSGDRFRHPIVSPAGPLSSPRLQRRFCFASYGVDHDDRDDAMRSYVAGLAASAHERGRVPVAKICRWGLRSAWLKQSCEASIICVVRDPDSTFRSYWSFGGRRSYFILGSLLLIAANRQRPCFRDIADTLGIPDLDAPTCREQLARALTLTLRWDVQHLRDIVATLWALFVVHNLEHADVVIDVNRLGEDSGYGRRAAAQVRRLTGHSVAFEDFRLASGTAAPGVPISAQGLQFARHAVRHLQRQPATHRLELGQFSERLISAIA